MRLASGKGVIGSSVLQRGKAGCSSLLHTEVLLPCQAGGEEGREQSPRPSSSSVPPSMPSLPPAADRNLGAAESGQLSGKGLDGAEIPKRLIPFYLCIFSTRPTHAVQSQALTCSYFC